MSQSITRGSRERALAGASSEPVVLHRGRLINGIRIFTAVMLLAGFSMAVWSLAEGSASLHLALGGATFFVLAGMGGVVLSLQAILAERQEFYRRGHLDGWMRGWRGQEPGGDDPILK